MTPEGATKLSICEYLALRRDVFFWVQESVGQWDAKRKIFRKKKSRFQRNGVADIQLKMLVARLPIDVQLEVKAPGNNDQSESQETFEADLQRFGGFYYVVRSVEDTTAALAEVRATVLQRITDNSPSRFSQRS